MKFKHGDIVCGVEGSPWSDCTGRVTLSTNSKNQNGVLITEDNFDWGGIPSDFGRVLFIDDESLEYVEPVVMESDLHKSLDSLLFFV